AVDREHSGAASGINNAVARVAGLLAIAVLGIIMLAVFRSHLERNMAQLHLPQAALHQVQQNELKLAAIPLPTDLELTLTEQLKTAIDQSFIFGFRIVMLICAALAAVSAVAWLVIER